MNRRGDEQADEVEQDAGVALHEAMNAQHARNSQRTVLLGTQHADGA